MSPAHTPAGIARRLLWLLLVLSLAWALAACGVAARQFERAADAATHVGDFGRSGRLTPEERLWARTAWRYVENNTDATTGLANGSDRRPVATMWNVADQLAALVAARELGILEAREFDLRMSRLLGTLASMDLSGGALPNKAYNTATGKMVNFENRPADIGWSALDVGRLMTWLRIVGQRHPVFQEYVDKIVLRWNFCRAISDCGALQGASREKDGALRTYPEGRFGYEQLAAAGYAAWGFDSSASAQLPPLEWFNVQGLPVPFDARDPRTTGVPAPVLTMPHVYLGMEFGWDPPGPVPSQQRLRAIAQRIFEVQKLRWEREQAFTARTDYQTSEAPYVVLDAVYAAGYPWNTVGIDNKEVPKQALVATRAAFGLWALWPGNYTDQLLAAVKHLHDPNRGWYEGRFEATGAPHAHVTLATNADVLRSLLFKVKGRLFEPDQPRGYFQRQTASPFQRTDRCLPRERPACRARD
ncbi:DUF3131 domain-containing protein [Ramlibacter sp. AN1015]|uniref:DUF3131 domain-containing protein n=1 Tax=Ramlibacter sp. AN1015 TaxID=3133428 RepID=UPI0030C493AE